MPSLRSLLLLTLPLASAAAQIRTVAITHVTIIDASDPLPRPDENVIIEGNVIVAVGPAAVTPVPEGSRVIPGAGKFLIPGLWDMHVHTVFPGGRQVLGLYVANGVLSVRDLAGDWNTIVGWRREIEAGTLVGPRIKASGPYIEGGDVPIVHFLAKTPEQARAAVDSLVRMGVDVIKLHSQLTREVYFAALRAARERGMRVAGHVPGSISAAEASDSGLGSIEHMLQIPVPCTAAESASLQPRFPVQRVVGRCTTQDLAPLFARFVHNDTWVVPTLTASWEVAHWPLRDLPGDAYAKYLPDTLKKYVAQIFPMLPDIPSDANVVGQQLFQKRLELVGALHHAGVGVLPGTDAPLRNSPPGFGLHEELALMVQAGMSPWDVLRAATLQPARYFDMLEVLGTVAEGKLADLVLLNADPLKDIHNTRKIEAVIQGGRVYDRAARQGMLRRAASS